MKKSDIILFATCEHKELSHIAGQFFRARRKYRHASAAWKRCYPVMGGRSSNYLAAKKWDRAAGRWFRRMQVISPYLSLPHDDPQWVPSAGSAVDGNL